MAFDPRKAMNRANRANLRTAAPNVHLTILFIKTHVYGTGLTILF